MAPRASPAATGHPLDPGREFLLLHRGQVVEYHCAAPFPAIAAANEPGVHTDDFQVELGDLFEPAGVGFAAAQQGGQRRNGSGGEDVGDHDVRGVQPGPDACYGLGRQHRIAAEGEEVVIGTDRVDTEHIADDRRERGFHRCRRARRSVPSTRPPRQPAARRRRAGRFCRPACDGICSTSDTCCGIMCAGTRSAIAARTLSVVELWVIGVDGRSQHLAAAGRGTTAATAVATPGIWRSAASTSPISTR